MAREFQGERRTARRRWSEPNCCRFLTFLAAKLEFNDAELIKKKKKIDFPKTGAGASRDEGNDDERVNGETWREEVKRRRPGREQAG